MFLWRMILLVSASRKHLSAGFMQMRALLELPQKDSLRFRLHDSSVAAAATRDLLGVQIAEDKSSEKRTAGRSSSPPDLFMQSEMQGCVLWQRQQQPNPHQTRE